MAYGSFRNFTRQNHGMARNRKADGFVNSAVDLIINYHYGLDHDGEAKAF